MIRLLTSVQTVLFVIGATYDLFNKHFVLLFSVFGILITLFGIAGPGILYFQQHFKFKSEIKRMHGDFKKLESEMERSANEIFETKQKMISDNEDMMHRIEKQREDLKEDIEKERKALKSEIEKTKQELYDISSDIHMKLGVVLSKMFKKDNKVEDIMPDIIDVIVIAMLFSLKSSKSNDIKEYSSAINFIYSVIKTTPNVIPKIEKSTTGILQEILGYDVIKNDIDSSNKLLEIINKLKKT